MRRFAKIPPDQRGKCVFVLTKGMSLIGPRPALSAEVARYHERAKRRLTVKPGCGGAWQAGSRSDSTFEEMVDLDLCEVGQGSAVVFAVRHPAEKHRRYCYANFYAHHAH